MSAMVRLTDLCSGILNTSRFNIQGSDNTLINNLGAHRVTDLWSEKPAIVIPKSGNASSGSKNVFVNDLPSTRVGDLVSACSSTMISGSGNVFVNAPLSAWY